MEWLLEIQERLNGVVIENKDFENRGCIKIAEVLSKYYGIAKTLEWYNVDGTNYVTIRALCDLLGVTVGYDSITNTVLLSK